MSSTIGGGRFAQEILGKLRDIQNEARSIGGVGGPGAGPGMGKSGGADAGGKSFADHLRDGVKEVDAAGKTSDKMAMELATGKTGNIHETMLASTQAELSFDLMVQLRNKGLEAYSEIMKMPV